MKLLQHPIVSDLVPKAQLVHQGTSHADDSVAIDTQGAKRKSQLLPETSLATLIAPQQVEMTFLLDCVHPGMAVQVIGLQQTHQLILLGAQRVQPRAFKAFTPENPATTPPGAEGILNDHSLEKSAAPI